MTNNYLNRLVRGAVRELVREIRTSGRTFFRSRKTLGSQMNVSGDYAPVAEVAEKYLGGRTRNFADSVIADSRSQGGGTLNLV